MTAAEVAPVVQPGDIWESRDSRDLGKGPRDLNTGRALPRRVRVIRVQHGRVLYENVVTGRPGNTSLQVFASRRMRGGYRRVSTSQYVYRVVSPAMDLKPRISRSMRDAGYKIQRRPLGLRGAVWEDAQ